MDVTSTFNVWAHRRRRRSFALCVPWAFETCGRSAYGAQYAPLIHSSAGTSSPVQLVAAPLEQVTAVSWGLRRYGALLRSQCASGASQLEGRRRCSVRYFEARRNQRPHRSGEPNCHWISGSQWCTVPYIFALCVSLERSTQFFCAGASCQSSAGENVFVTIVAVCRLC